MGGRDPLLALDRRERPQFGHPARRLQVVEDRFVAGEPLEPHHLLGQQRPVLAKRDVALGGDARRALRTIVRIASEVPSPVLLALERLEQRLEVALAEAAGAVALDQLEEHRRPVADRLA